MKFKARPEGVVGRRREAPLPVDEESGEFDPRALITEQDHLRYLEFLHDGFKVKEMYEYATLFPDRREALDLEKLWDRINASLEVMNGSVRASILSLFPRRFLPISDSYTPPTEATMDDYLDPARKRGSGRIRKVSIQRQVEARAYLLAGYDYPTDEAEKLWEAAEYYLGLARASSSKLNRGLNFIVPLAMLRLVDPDRVAKWKPTPRELALAQVELKIKLRQERAPDLSQSPKSLEAAFSIFIATADLVRGPQKGFAQVVQKATGIQAPTPLPPRNLV